MRDNLQIDPLPNLSESPRGSAAYFDISGFTGKPVKGEGFNDPRGVLQMLVYQKTKFGRYYCIKSFCHLISLEKRF